MPTTRSTRVASEVTSPDAEPAPDAESGPEARRRPGRHPGRGRVRRGHRRALQRVADRGDQRPGAGERRTRCGRVLRHRQHDHARIEHRRAREGHGRPGLLHHRRGRGLHLEAAEVRAVRPGEHGRHGPGHRERPAVRQGPRAARDRGHGRAGLRRADGGPPVGRHRRAGGGAQGPRPRGVAGQRDPGRGRRRHRPAPRAHRRARDDRRGRRRALHGQARAASPCTAPPRSRRSSALPPSAAST